jgi:hypothetical protein
MPNPIDELREVSSNETITAEAWNNLIDAIQVLYQELDAFQSQRPGWIVVSVRVENGEELGHELTGSEISTVAASATADMERTYIGRRVRGRYVISHLPPGLYDVRVAPTIASGFSSTIRRGVQVQSGSAAVVDVFVRHAEVVGLLPRVPDLFNRSLQESLDLLAHRGLTLGQVLDAHGQVVPITTSAEAGALHYVAPPDFADRPVIGSEPGEGMELAPGTVVSLLISTAGRGEVEPVSVVRVPELFNRMLQDALDTLMATYLVPGAILDVNGQPVAVDTIADPITGQLHYQAPTALAARRVVASEPSANVLVNVHQPIDLLIAAA